MELSIALILIGLANLILSFGALLYQARVNAETCRAIDRLNRRLRDLEVKAGWRG